MTLNLCRAFTVGGYADLHQAHGWNQDFVKESPSGQHYERLADETCTGRLAPIRAESISSSPVTT